MATTELDISRGERVILALPGGKSVGLAFAKKPRAKGQVCEVTVFGGRGVRVLRGELVDPSGRPSEPAA